MLKKHSQFFVSLLTITDMLILAAAWILAYYLRFKWGPIPVTKGVPPFGLYSSLLPWALGIWFVVFKAAGLYQPMRTSTRFHEIQKIFQATSLAMLIFIVFAFFIKDYKYSRVVYAYFGAINFVAFCASRMVFRQMLRYIRAKGYNLRFTLVVGNGKLGREVVEKIQQHMEVGIKIIGFLTDNPDEVGRVIAGARVVGTYDDIQRIIRERTVDQIFIALPLDAHQKMDQILKNIEGEMMDIKVIPDLYQYITLRGSVEEFDGLPIVSLRDSPLYGWNRLLKRFFDILLSLAAVALTSPIMLLIMGLMKIATPGPIFYRQERMGLDGKTFDILKFRTMTVDAEQKTGAVWAKPADPRRTRLGAVLRNTSLDELPQLFNVLRGDMSMVGPRPERPMFVEQFKGQIPKYMLRHKMKAGMTGWAQINGWRGSTSLEKRIECDLYYIENWSLGMDFRILWLTFFKGFRNKNAY